MARSYDIRLSLHPSQYILLNALDEMSLDGLRPRSRGGYARRPSIWRPCREYFPLHPALPKSTGGHKARLTVENDEVSYPITDTLRIHEATGCPVVFDNLHHFCLNPERLSIQEAPTRALATWPTNVIPKIHYSSPSTDFNTKTEKEKGAAGRERSVKKLRAPLLKAHADFINPLEFVLFWEAVGGNSRSLLISCWKPKPKMLRCCVCGAN